MNGIYFSGNGNTKHCMETFTKATGGKAVSIESPKALELLKTESEIALGYPTHYSNIPSIVKEFILQNGKLFCGKKVFVIVTMGLFSGDGAGLGARLLKKQGAKILGGLHLRMPDVIGDVKMLKKPINENTAIIKTAEQKIALTASAVKDGKPVFTAGKCTICYRCANACPERAITLLGKQVLEQCRFDIYAKSL